MDANRRTEAKYTNVQTDKYVEKLRSMMSIDDTDELLTIDAGTQADRQTYERTGNEKCTFKKINQILTSIFRTQAQKVFTYGSWRQQTQKQVNIHHVEWIISGVELLQKRYCLT